MAAIITPLMAPSTCFITGGAGFIGSNLVDRLLGAGHKVVVFDNFSTGQPEFLAAARRHAGFRLIEGDLLNRPALPSAMQGCDIVFHLAANADIRFGLDHPRRDLEQNTLATFNVLEAMRSNGIRRIVFASSAAALGEPEVFPTPENCPTPIQTSLYGASKMACEGLVSSYCEGFGFEGYIFRFVSLLGERYPHGHVIDFYRSLRSDPTVLRVLGDGTQRKAYLHVQDCVSAILRVVALETAVKAKHRVQIYNLGYPEYIELNSSIQWICEHLQISPRLEYAGGAQGWIGDSPFVFLDVGKIRSTGWEPVHSIRQSIVATLDWLVANPWILERR
jgi:UDP-glucose 4-epimerase